MRQYVASEALDKNGCLFVTGKDFRYISTVLRSVPGDMLYVRLPDGVLQQMTVASVDSASKKIVLQCAGKRLSESAAPNEAPPVKQAPDCELWLFQFVAKPPKMDLIIRQAVECGVSVVVPVEGVFCQKGNIESCRKRSDSKDKRWPNIINEARGQSGSPVATKVLSCMSLEKASELWRKECEGDGDFCAVVLYEQTKGTKTISEAFSGLENKKVRRVAVAVGAEGGISPEEIECLSQAGFLPIHFLTNILRCETAALYGIAAVQTVLSEKKIWQFKE